MSIIERRWDRESHMLVDANPESEVAMNGKTFVADHRLWTSEGVVKLDNHKWLTKIFIVGLVILVILVLVLMFVRPAQAADVAPGDCYVLDGQTYCLSKLCTPPGDPPYHFIITQADVYRPDFITVTWDAGGGYMIPVDVPLSEVNGGSASYWIDENHGTLVQARAAFSQAWIDAHGVFTQSGCEPTAVVLSGFSARTSPSYPGIVVITISLLFVMLLVMIRMRYSKDDRN